MQWCPGAVGVHHQGYAVAGGGAGRAHLGLADLVQLDETEAVIEGLARARGDTLLVQIPHQARVSGNLAAPRAAEQPMQRQSGRLAGDIPERNVDAADGEQGDPVATPEMVFLLQVV